MNYKRRNFMRTTGALATGALLLPQWACKSATEKADSEETENWEEEMTGSLDEFGLQLYTLRDLIPKDPKGILKQVASFGYQQIEGYEGPQGMFWNMGHTGFKSYLDELGMQMVSSHCNINENFAEKAAQAAEIGMEYLICPYIGAQKSKADWDKVIEKFNKCGETCNANGIKFAYHNHAYTFEEVDGIMPQDYLMEQVDPDLVDFQLDIYWVVTGGADPIEYLKKYPNRFKLCHVKDRKKGVSLDVHEASCDLGTGSINFPEILKVAADNGMEYYILEQELYENSTPLKSAEKGAQYLKNLVFA